MRKKFMKIKIGLTVDLGKLSNALEKIGLKLYWSPLLRGVVLRVV